MKHHTALPVVVENDAHAAALSELHCGAASGLTSLSRNTMRRSGKEGNSMDAIR